jgi:hypothetical protein
MAARPPSEKDAKLAQKLGQLQPFIAVLPRNAWPNLHLLGQPNTFLAEGERQIDIVYL